MKHLEGVLKKLLSPAVDCSSRRLRARPPLSAVVRRLSAVPLVRGTVCRSNKRARPFGRALVVLWNRELAADLRYVLGRGALGALDDVEFDALAFGEGAEAAALDRRMVDEAILLTTLGRDEAEALRVIEPLHGAGSACHTNTPKNVDVSSEYRGNRTYRPTVTVPPNLVGLVSTRNKRLAD